MRRLLILLFLVSTVASAVAAKLYVDRLPMQGEYTAVPCENSPISELHLIDRAALSFDRLTSTMELYPSNFLVISADNF
jgi:hypothetical protein